MLYNNIQELLLFQDKIKLKTLKLSIVSNKFLINKAVDKIKMHKFIIAKIKEIKSSIEDIEFSGIYSPYFWYANDRAISIQYEAKKISYHLRKYRKKYDKK